MTQTREELIQAMNNAILACPVIGPDMARAALAAIEEHAAVVPREPTRAMCIHGEMRAVDYDCKPADDVALEAMGMIYRAMLAASPFAPEARDD